MAGNKMTLVTLAVEFGGWMLRNSIPTDAGDASEILASGKLDKTQEAYVRNFIARWEAVAEPNETGERWHVDTNAARMVVKDENGLAVAFITGDPLDKGVQQGAYLIAGAPALRDALNALYDWIENNVAYGVPRALAEECGQALQDARPPL